MDVDYKKLFNRVKEKGIKNKTDFISITDISTNILAKLSKDEFIPINSLKKDLYSF